MWMWLKDGKNRSLTTWGGGRERNTCSLPALLHPRAEVLLAKKRAEHPQTPAVATPLLLGKSTPTLSTVDRCFLSRLVPQSFSPKKSHKGLHLL